MICASMEKAKAPKVMCLPTHVLRFWKRQLSTNKLQRCFVSMIVTSAQQPRANEQLGNTSIFLHTSWNALLCLHLESNACAQNMISIPLFFNTTDHVANLWINFKFNNKTLNYFYFYFYHVNNDDHTPKVTFC